MNKDQELCYERSILRILESILIIHQKGNSDEHAIKAGVVVGIKSRAAIF